MQSNRDTPPRQGSPHATRNYPQTPAEVAAILDSSAIPSLSVETVGAWIDPPPKPFSRQFTERFAATVAADPVTYGRIFLHAIGEARRGT